MNRDTLYSSAVFDLTTLVTIVKPDPGKRLQRQLCVTASGRAAESRESQALQADKIALVGANRSTT
jgi:hypothetical protein